MSFNFGFKKSKVLVNGISPIYLRLIIEGKRIEFTTRRYIILQNKTRPLRKCQERMKKRIALTFV
ncbi:MAG: hypothetical protein EOP42_04905 [Sphingobacteriaceae bacterium]|nr:MAG: hypothetical protein EOP42_04905 [Sphingobacteriaceae bacterium]